MRFLKSTEDVLPRNVQEIIVGKVSEANKERRAYYKELDKLLVEGERRKNLYMNNVGFRFRPSNLEHYRARARGDERYKRSLRNYYNRRRQFVNYVMDDTTVMTRPEKKRLVERILTDKNFNPTKDELKRYGFK